MILPFIVRPDRAARLAAMQRHPAGRRRLATGNVKALPAPDWSELRNVTRMPERIQ